MQRFRSIGNGDDSRLFHGKNLGASRRQSIGRNCESFSAQMRSLPCFNAAGTFERSSLNARTTSSSDPSEKSPAASLRLEHAEHEITASKRTLSRWMLAPNESYRGKVTVCPIASVFQKYSI